MNEMTQLLVLGAGAFAEDVADMVSEMQGVEIAGFIESKDPTKSGAEIVGRRILWIDDLPENLSAYRGFSAVGSTHRRIPIERLEMLGLEFISLVHPTAQCSKTAKRGRGVLISRGSIVSAGVWIGSHVVINRGCLIGHHVRIGDYSTVSPGANLAGGSEIGSGTYVGMGAIILNGVHVGHHAIIGAGAVVTRDVPDCVQVMGIPARVTKTDIEGL